MSNFGRFSAFRPFAPSQARPRSSVARLGVISLGALALGILPACGGGSTTPEADASYEGPVASSDVAGGEHEFQEYCVGCHTEQSGSYGPTLRNIAWTPARMREQIREGSGRMPGFGASQISADELEQTLAYLVTIGSVAEAPAATSAADASAPTP